MHVWQIICYFVRNFKVVIYAMKKRTLFTWLLALTLVVACKQQTVEQTPEEQTSVAVKEETKPCDPIADKDGIREYAITQGGHKYVIVVERKADKEAPVVKDILGTLFYDNTVSISIKRDGADFYHRIFRKNDFDKMLSEEDRTYGTLAGMSLNEDGSKGDVLAFFAQVCMPGMDGGMHAKVLLSLKSLQLTFEVDDTPDLDLVSLHAEEEGV